MIDPKIIKGLAGEREQVATKFGKLREAADMLRKARVEVDRLVKLGDIITTDDVVKAAGNLVAAGLEPAAMAAMLADMPTSNAEQLAMWIAEQEKGLAQRELQLRQVTGQIGHELSTVSLQELMAHAISAGAAPPAALPLMPQGGEAAPLGAPAGDANALMGGMPNG